MRNFPDGARIYAAGDAPGGLYAVVRGSVEMMHHAPTGDYSIYYVNTWRSLQRVLGLNFFNAEF